MPLYTYTCDQHGEFSTWTGMAQSDLPQPCPSCTEPAPRALARPALGGRTEDSDLAGGCGQGMCATESPRMAGGCCGGGACVH